MPIASEWSRTIDGRIDFYIPEKRWAVELLRDHSNIGEHVSRFKTGGTYYPWLQEKMVEDWIVIDCATTLPNTGKLFILDPSSSSMVLNPIHPLTIW